MERVLNGRARRAGWPIDEQAGDGGDSPAWSRKRGEYRAPELDRPPATGAVSVPYAELHAHSAYSFLDGASTPEELVEEAARLCPEAAPRVLPWVGAEQVEREDGVRARREGLRLGACLLVQNGQASF